MEKKATYTVMSPPPTALPLKRRWLSWFAVVMSVVAIVVASLTAAVVKEQATRVTRMEGRIMEIETHIEDILRLTIANHEYDYADYEYDDDYDDDDEGDDEGLQLKNGPSEGITVRRVVRRRRQTNSIDNDVSDGPKIPIFDQPYGIDLKQAATKGLRLYDAKWDTEEDDDQEDSEGNTEVTESPIKPHHRISSLWVPKRKRTRLPTSSSGPQTLSSRPETLVHRIDSANGNGEEIVETFLNGPATARNPRLTQRRSRTKNLHGSRRGTKRQQKKGTKNNKAEQSVIFRNSFVKATSRHDGYTSPNSVVPPVPVNLDTPRVVQQDVGRPVSESYSYTRPPTESFFGKKKRKPRNKQHRRRRRGRPIITLAHFGASLTNTTTHQGEDRGQHLDWTPATWMDKLGLNAKYSLERGTVTVKEAGLYYLYAQVLYESGRSGAGFQILVDDIPILECQLPALRPAPSCLTGGLSYLPRNAKVRVRDLNTNLVTVKRHQNTFFGMVKLMSAPHSAEMLLLA